jgi:F-type H+-transporting ATPase subunit delta
MAERETLARPYAEAAFRLARDKSSLPAWSGMLHFASQLSADERVARFARDPKIPRARFLELFLGVLGDRATPELANFVRVLQANGRLVLLPEITMQFDELRAEAEGTVVAEVVSAFDVSADEQNRIKTALAKRLNRRVTLTTRVDRALIGGVVIRAGDMVIDGSVRGRLQTLANVLEQ